METPMTPWCQPPEEKLHRSSATLQRPSETPVTKTSGAGPLMRSFVWRESGAVAPVWAIKGEL